MLTGFYLKSCRDDHHNLCHSIPVVKLPYKGTKEREGTEKDLAFFSFQWLFHREEPVL